MLPHSSSLGGSTYGRQSYRFCPVDARSRLRCKCSFPSRSSSPSFPGLDMRASSGPLMHAHIARRTNRTPPPITLSSVTSHTTFPPSLLPSRLLNHVYHTFKTPITKPQTYPHTHLLSCMRLGETCVSHLPFLHTGHRQRERDRELWILRQSEFASAISNVALASLYRHTRDPDVRPKARSHSSFLLSLPSPVKWYGDNFPFLVKVTASQRLSPFLYFLRTSMSAKRIPPNAYNSTTTATLETCSPSDGQNPWTLHRR